MFFKELNDQLWIFFDELLAKVTITHITCLISNKMSSVTYPETWRSPYGDATSPAGDVASLAGDAASL